jgi:ATP-dependent DNA helicase DinG
MRIYLAADVPEPSAAEGRLDLEALTDHIRYCTLATAGGSLVLFTSYRDLQDVARRLTADYQKAGRPLLVQEAGVSRSALAERMREAGNGVLFGTESFWTGIDVPGDALAQVIITRLPFEPPHHPVAQARAEWIASEGGNPFAQLALPDALGKFRQGIGRLIRSKTDRGVVTVLDPRVLTKPYGREFVACLPTPEFERLTRANREQVFRPFI